MESRPTSAPSRVPSPNPKPGSTASTTFPSSRSTSTTPQPTRPASTPPSPRTRSSSLPDRTTTRPSRRQTTSDGLQAVRTDPQKGTSGLRTQCLRLCLRRRMGRLSWSLGRIRRRSRSRRELTSSSFRSLLGRFPCLFALSSRADAVADRPCVHPSSQIRHVRHSLSIRQHRRHRRPQRLHLRSHHQDIQLEHARLLLLTTHISPLLFSYLIPPPPRPPYVPTLDLSVRTLLLVSLCFTRYPSACILSPRPFLSSLSRRYWLALRRQSPDIP